MKAYGAIFLLLGFFFGLMLGALVGVGVAKDSVKCIEGVSYYHAGSGVYTKSDSQCLVDEGAAK